MVTNVVLKFIPVIAIIFLCLNSVYGSTTGKISGQIKDAETGEPLIGANVIIKGTTMGAATDIEGKYFIINIPPGTYTVSASMVGYTPSNQSEVIVLVNRSITVDFSLYPLALGMEEVTVVAKRDIVKKDVSASIITLRAVESIQNAPIKDFADFLNLQPGVEDLLVRGGTQDQTAFMVDGFMMVDERRNQPIMTINLSAIQEVELMTGGFNAEYGNARSGVINIITKEGGEKYSGSLDFRFSPPHYKHFSDELYWTADWERWAGPSSMEPSEDFIGWNAYAEQLNSDNDPTNDITPEGARNIWEWQHRRIDYGEQGPVDYIGEGSFSGPIPFINDVNFFVSYRRGFESSLVPLYARLDYSTLGETTQSIETRINYKIIPEIKLNLSYLNINQDYLRQGLWTVPRNFLPLGPNNVNAGNAEEANIFGTFGKYSYQMAPAERISQIAAAKITHMLSSKDFYTVQLEMAHIKDIVSPGPIRNTGNIFEYEPGKYLDEGPLGPYPQGDLTDQIGVYHWSGGPFLTDNSYITTWRIRSDINSQIDNYNLIKGGVEIVLNNLHEDMSYVDSKHTLTDTRYEWDRYPIRASAYLQDKFEWEGMIANIGLRADYADANVDWFTGDPYNKYYGANYRDSIPLIPTAQSDPKFYFSPRVGISHPISEIAKIYFNYGHFYSVPTNDQYYGFVQGTSFDNRVTLLGNPGLLIPRTIAYELGFDFDLYNEILLHVVGYYKNVTEQAGTVTYISRFGDVNYQKYANNNYQDIRGFEIRVEKKYGRYFYGWLNYNYMQISNGNIGNATVYQDPRISPAVEDAQQFRPVVQPSLKASIDFHTPLDYGTEWGGFYPLGGWTFNVIYTWRSGAHFTYLPQNTGEVNNVQMVDYTNTDLRIQKQFDGPLGFKTDIYAYVTNLFNEKYLNQNAFSDQEWTNYMNSLKLPIYQGERNGNDRVGIYPHNSENEHVDINVNPLNRWQLFLWPREIYFGVRILF